MSVLTPPVMSQPAVGAVSPNVQPHNDWWGSLDPETQRKIQLILKAFQHSPDFPWVQQQLRLQTPQPSQSYFHWVRWQQRMRLGQPEALAWRAAVEDEIRINNSRLQAQAPSPVSTQAQPSPPVNPAQTPQSAAQTPRFGESNIFTNQSTAQEASPTTLSAPSQVTHRQSPTQQTQSSAQISPPTQFHQSPGIQTARVSPVQTIQPSPTAQSLVSPHQVPRPNLYYQYPAPGQQAQYVAPSQQTQQVPSQYPPNGPTMQQIHPSAAQFVPQYQVQNVPASGGPGFGPLHPAQGVPSHSYMPQTAQYAIPQQRPLHQNPTPIQRPQLRIGSETANARAFEAAGFVGYDMSLPQTSPISVGSSVPTPQVQIVEPVTRASVRPVADTDIKLEQKPESESRPLSTRESSATQKSLKDILDGLSLSSHNTQPGQAQPLRTRSVDRSRPVRPIARSVSNPKVKLPPPSYSFKKVEDSSAFYRLKKNLDSGSDEKSGTKKVKASPTRSIPASNNAQAGPSRMNARGENVLRTNGGSSNATGAEASTHSGSQQVTMEEVRKIITPEALAEGKVLPLLKLIRREMVDDVVQPALFTPTPQELWEILTQILNHAPPLYLDRLGKTEKNVMSLRRWLTQFSKNPAGWQSCIIPLFQLLAKILMDEAHVLKIGTAVNAVVEKAEEASLSNLEEIKLARKAYQKFVRRNIIGQGRGGGPGGGDGPGGDIQPSASGGGGGQSGGDRGVGGDAPKRSSEVEAGGQTKKARTENTNAVAGPSRQPTAPAARRDPAPGSIFDTLNRSTTPVASAAVPRKSTPGPSSATGSTNTTPAFIPRRAANRPNTAVPAVRPTAAGTIPGSSLLSQTILQLQTRAEVAPGTAPPLPAALPAPPPRGPTPNRRGHNIKWRTSAPTGDDAVDKKHDERNELEDIRYFTQTEEEKERAPWQIPEADESDASTEDRRNQMERAEARALRTHETILEEVNWYEPSEIAARPEPLPPTEEVTREEARERTILTVNFPPGTEPPTADETLVQFVDRDERTGNWSTGMDPSLRQPYNPAAAATAAAAQVQAPPSAPVGTDFRQLLRALDPSAINQAAQAAAPATQSTAYAQLVVAQEQQQGPQNGLGLTFGAYVNPAPGPGIPQEQPNPGWNQPQQSQYNYNQAYQGGQGTEQNQGGGREWANQAGFQPYQQQNDQRAGEWRGGNDRHRGGDGAHGGRGGGRGGRGRGRGRGGGGGGGRDRW